jgi:hypothetical protein
LRNSDRTPRGYWRCRPCHYTASLASDTGGVPAGHGQRQGMLGTGRSIDLVRRGKALAFKASIDLTVHSLQCNERTVASFGSQFVITENGPAVHAQAGSPSYT